MGGSHLEWLVAMVTHVEGDPGKVATSGASLLGTDLEEVSQCQEGPSWGDLAPDHPRMLVPSPANLPKINK